MPRNRELAAVASGTRNDGDESRLLEEVVAVLSLTAAVFAFLSFLAYHQGAGVHQFSGRVGHELASAVVQGVGLAAYLVPALLAVVAVLAFRQASAEISVPRAVGAFVLLSSVATLLGLVRPDAPVAYAGGWWGGFLSLMIRRAFGTGGSLVLTLTSLLLTFMFVTRISLGSLASAVWRTLRKAPETVGSSVSHAVERLEVAVGRETVRKEPPPSESGPIIVLGDVLGDPLPVVTPVKKSRRPAREMQEQFPFVGNGEYQIPSPLLMERSQTGSIPVDEEMLRKSSQILEAKLADFGIQGRVVEVRPGPVITTFDIEPAPGIKVNRIVSLGDDLAMALRVPGVRILAPVPGKAVVGIEVANARRQDVRLREMLESEPFEQSASPLTLALGKDTAGTAVIGDLARMPHLLVAGATGSGKSVAINAMIMSILYKARPRDVRFVMIDLKMLELSIYEDIPHLLVPVITDPKKAVVVLQNIVEEMEDRYRLMKDRAVRGIDSYNRLVDAETQPEDAAVIELDVLADDDEEAGSNLLPVAPAPSTPQRLPKIVVIIDELADLIMTMGRKVEEPITRLAQKARAAGIHLILATQRPSVDVITGLIKANFPARVSFQTVSRVDSRTILDQIGAERLLGGGDMLFMPPGSARVQRLHGPLVTESEILRVVESIKRQGRPQYALQLLEAPEGEEGGEEGVDDLSDELYDQAVQLVTETRQASISWVQRRLRVGYNRAARMIERMEREGVVSPSEGGRPREVIAQRVGEP